MYLPLLVFLLIAIFPKESFFFSTYISKVDIIDCKTKVLTIAYLFALTIASESNTSNNISVFEDPKIS